MDTSLYCVLYWRVHIEIRKCIQSYSCISYRKNASALLGISIWISALRSKPTGKAGFTDHRI